MAGRHNPEKLLSFPCHYEFKAFGQAADALFADAVRLAVNQVVPVCQDALRIRLSKGGRYQCVTALVRLENSVQLTEVYANLRQLEGLCYLL